MSQLNSETIYKFNSETIYKLCISSNPFEKQMGYQRLAKILNREARRMVNVNYFDLTFVEDCVQDALHSIWQRLRDGEGPRMPSEFLAWAIVITRRRCIDRIRHEQRYATMQHNDEFDLDDDNYVEPASLVPISEIPHNVILSDEKTKTLIETIQRHPNLSDSSKTVLIEGFLNERSDNELAKMLKTSPLNIRVIRHRSLEKLRGDDAFMEYFRDQI